MRITLHKLIPIIIIALAALIAVGCSDSRVAGILHQADSVMEEHPDSARMMLDGIDSLRLNKSQASLYAVLDAQSRHKLNMPPPASDSLLNLAVDRYTAHGPDSLLMKALFYRAAGHMSRGDLERAAGDATIAWELASSINDHYWRAKSAELIADLTDRTCNYQEEIGWRRMAAVEYGIAGKEWNRLSALCDVASTYLNLHDSESALALDDSIRQFVMKYSDDTDLQIYHAYTSMFIQNSYGSIERADSLYEFLKDIGYDMEGDPSVSLVRANCLLGSEKYDECRKYLDSISPYLSSVAERSMLQSLHLRLGRATGTPDMVESATDSLLIMQLELISGALHQPVTSTQRDYFQVNMLAKDEARKRAVSLGWIIFIGSVCIIMIGITFHRHRMRRKEQQLEEKISNILAVSEQLDRESVRNRELEAQLDSIMEINRQLGSAVESARDSATIDTVRIDALKTELKDRDDSISRLRRQLSIKSGYLSDLYLKKWSTLNMLCREFINRGSNGDASIIVSNISNELEKLKSPLFYRSLEKDLDKYTDGVMSRLREEMAGLSENEMRLAMLIMAGLTANTISLLTGRALSSVYAGRQRIIRKIVKGNPMHKELYLTFLEK